MNKNFKPIQLLQHIADTGKTGHFQITANQVTWDLYFIEGMLRDATHSLQSVATIQHYLLRHDQEKIVKCLPTFAKNVLPNQLLIPGILKQLKEQKDLTADDWFMVSTDVIKDALESYLWLQEGDYRWHDQEKSHASHQTTIKEDHLLTISTLLDTFLSRMKAWRRLAHVITSPHQRLLCPNSSLIHQKVPSGTLNAITLGQLVKVMEGRTLRQISLFLKQDELKVAQLLLPYFQHNILELQPPQPPLDKLPLISPSTQTPQLPQQNVAVKPSVNSDAHPSSQTKQEKSKLLKIVCIDDSPTILDMIKAYLSDQFEVFTVDNPTQSHPCLFECKPDLILIDFSMPGINGNKLCRIIKGSSFFKNTPIIMISGNEKMLTPENMKEAGATDYLAKPFTKEALQTIIHKYLSTNTNSNQQLNPTTSDRDSSLISTEQVETILSNDPNRKPIKITRNSQDIDAITRLPNRQCFDQYLSAVLKDAQKTQSSCSLIFLKIDNFTDIQATLGQTRGNKILQNVVKQIQSSVRGNDVIARWSNDEFVILFSHIDDKMILNTIGQRIVNTIQTPPLLLPHQLTLTCIIHEDINKTKKSEIIPLIA